MHKISISRFFIILFLSSFFTISTVQASESKDTARALAIVEELKVVDGGAMDFNLELGLLMSQMTLKKLTYKDLNISEGDIVRWRKEASKRYILKEIIPVFVTTKDEYVFNHFLHLLHQELGLSDQTYVDVGLEESTKIAKWRESLKARISKK